MSTVSGVRTAVLKHEKLQPNIHGGRRNIGRIFDDFGKYLVDFAVNFSSKSDLGRRGLHKTVQEEIKDQSPLNPCHSQKHVTILKEKEIQSKIQEMQEEMNNVKHKIGASSEKMEPMSSDTSPPKQLKDKDFMLPDKKRIMIRSHRKPNCSGRGAACLDPRFIGGDGIVFYFHGKSNQHFSLVSDLNFQVNARFIGLRPAGRTRDYTWIQALGILFDSHSFSLEATPAAQWDDQVDHLKFSYDGQEVDLPEGYRSNWTARDLKVERTDKLNSVIVTVAEIAEISVNVVPVTKEDDRIHNYQIPSDNCFAHLEVQFRFFGLSSEVEGVIGRTYQPDFKNPAKPGVAMPVVGGEDRYKTSTLLTPDCKSCRFSPVGVMSQDVSFLKDLGMLDCTGSTSSGNGIVCRK
ncbi:hypothetical protein KSS87_006329 [Heliosperma pusillum]|nr:hypothetical protein KSS87_006329 [Heliosperma pusillum]